MASNLRNPDDIPIKLSGKILLRAVATLSEEETKKIHLLLQRGMDNLTDQKAISPSLAKSFRQWRNGSLKTSFIKTFRRRIMAKIYYKCDNGCEKPASTKWQLGRKYFCSADCKIENFEKMKTSRIFAISGLHAGNECSLEDLKSLLKIDKQPAKKEFAGDKCPKYIFRIGNRVYVSPYIIFTIKEIEQEIELRETFFRSLGFDLSLFPMEIMEKIYYRSDGRSPYWEYKQPVISTTGNYELTLNKGWVVLEKESKVLFGEAAIGVTEDKLAITGSKPSIVEVITTDPDYINGYTEGNVWTFQYIILLPQ